MVIEENVPLAPLTTFKIGGPARFFVRVATRPQLEEALVFARSKNLEVLVLGGGSNVLIDDAGFDGLVIKIELMGIERAGDTFVVGAGESWDALVEHSVREGLWGLENLSGIPGSVGAAPVQNIGAYGSEVKDTLLWVEALDTEQSVVVRFTNEECAFGYRTSRFKKEPGRYVLLKAAFALSAEPAPNLSYRDLQLAFASGASPTVRQVREVVLAIRARKFPDLTREGTAGSFFLNPVVGEEAAVRLRQRFPTLPQYPGEGGTKVSLAWLLDNALALKGVAVGSARLFEQQPLVVVAARGASAQEVRALAQIVKQKVKKELDIDIEEEVRIFF